MEFHLKALAGLRGVSRTATRSPPGLGSRLEHPRAAERARGLAIRTTPIPKRRSVPKRATPRRHVANPSAAKPLDIDQHEMPPTHQKPAEIADLGLRFVRVAVRRRIGHLPRLLKLDNGAFVPNGSKALVVLLKPTFFVRMYTNCFDKEVVSYYPFDGERQFPSS
jgi:hypothetical protein